MSRIAKYPVAIPDKVEVALGQAQDTRELTLKGRVSGRGGGNMLADVGSHRLDLLSCS